MAEVEIKIIENLKAFGLDTDIKPVTIKHLVKITEVLENLTSLQASAIKDIKDNKISINRVAKESGIARQTFYNNPVITAYVEKYISSFAVDNPYETIELLREELRNKDKQIEQMVQRDASVSKYKAQNQALTDEIASLQSTIKSQEDLIHQLQKKVLRSFN